MYLAASRGRPPKDPASATQTSPPSPPPSGAAGRTRLAGTVVALGAVSLVTDISSEMVTAVLPLYFVLGLGLSPLQFGFLDGLFNGATAVIRVLGVHAADRTGRHKRVAGLGYALSALSRIGLLLAGGAAAGIAAALTADRIGKGIRTAPRDALITLNSPPDVLGGAFGVHRARGPPRPADRRRRCHFHPDRPSALLPQHRGGCRPSRVAARLGAGQSHHLRPRL